MNVVQAAKLVAHIWFEDVIQGKGVRPIHFGEFMLACAELTKDKRYENGFRRNDVHRRVTTEQNSINRYIDIAWEAGLIERMDDKNESPSKHQKSIWRLSEDGLARVELELETVENKMG